jgi:TonB family protein
MAELRGEIERLRRKRAELRRVARARQAEIARLRARAAGGPRGNGGVNEWFDDVPRGPQTRLNTRAFEESRYYLDFKTSYGLAFRPGVVSMGLHFPPDPARRPRTILSIEVGADGSLREARVLRTSGYSALDRDALDATRRVFPFDRPPATLVGPGGTLRFLFEVIF